MKYLIAFILLFSSFILSTTLSGQSSVGTNDFKQLVKLEMDIMKSFGTLQNTIFEAESNASFIIDFQDIPVNIKSVKLLDADANIVFMEDVSNLATDVLYEIDLSHLSLSTYTLQLEAYTKTFFIDLSK